MIDVLLGRKLLPPAIMNAGFTSILIQLDAAISESHHYENTVTEFPVDDGLDITDHIRQNPDVYEIEGIVTNSPVNGNYQITGDNDQSYRNSLPLVNDYQAVVNNGLDRVITAYEALLLITGRKMTKMPLKTQNDQLANFTIETKPVLVDISTKLRVFNDMAIIKLDFDFDNRTGDALPFKATARHVRKVSIGHATINFTNGSLYGSSGVEDNVANDDKGSQPTKVPDPVHVSALKATSDAIANKQNPVPAFFGNLFNF